MKRIVIIVSWVLATSAMVAIAAFLTLRALGAWDTNAGTTGRRGMAGMMQNMMGGGMMAGDRSAMREMMRGMMGNVLPPGVDPALLPDRGSEGGRLLARYCTQCHDLPGPGLHTAAEWPSVVGRMNARMQMMAGMKGCMMEVDAPRRDELQTLTAYLQEHAQQPIDRAAYPDLDSPAGRAFMSACSQCHAAPDPRQHAAPDWPGVVARMRGHMEAMGKTVPHDADMKDVVAFLQRHGRDR